MTRKRSKIVTDLIMNKIDVQQAIQSLDFILDDIDDKKIKKWVSKEIKGYGEKDEIPNYRVVSAILMGDIQVGLNLYPNVNIPLIDKEAFDFFNRFEVREPISVVMQYAIAEKEHENHSLQLDANTAIVNKYQYTNGNVIRAHRTLSLFAYTNVLSLVKDKLLEIYKYLEKNYGNLDDLYIDFSDKKKQKETIKYITNIIYSDNSTKIGSNNTIKGSVIGDDNEN